MYIQHARLFSRRRFLSGVTLAGTVGLLGLHPRPVAAEPPPETTRLRLVKELSICLAPLYVAEELLHGEGFTEVRYVDLEGGPGTGHMIGARKADFGMDVAPAFIMNIDAGEPLVALGGVHVGCYELFGTNGVRAVRDLKGKTIAVTQLRDDRHAYVASMLTQVGLDPRKDVRWVEHPAPAAMQLLAEGKLDAWLAFPPFVQALRAQQIGHVVVSSIVDRPWSQYFCCMAAAHRDFVQKHPVATKRALRAILKANAICALEPERATRYLVDKGYTAQRDYALQALQEIPYAKWREYDPEDTLRFYALRLHEAGMIKSSPQKIIAQGTDWRFLTELKKELKG